MPADSLNQEIHAKSADHIAQAKKNERFLDAIAPMDEFADWGVVTLFYAAVHYGRALLVGKSGAVTTHQRFQSYVPMCDG